ncbi:MAG: hypothetical protein K2Q18_17565 [Bdellovibrionales bacterium]|nr:hypothetical protein [Bdellovibrionales bacterium]
MKNQKDISELLNNLKSISNHEKALDYQESAIGFQTEVIASNCVSHLNSELQVNDKKIYRYIQYYFCLLQFPFHLFTLWQAGEAARSIEVEGVYFDQDVNDFAPTKLPGVVAANNYILYKIATRFQFLYRKNAQRKWYELYDNLGQKILFESRMLRQLEVISVYSLTFVTPLILIMMSLAR